MVNYVYFDPVTDQFWVIDYRTFNPDRDGKTKLDHVREMLLSAIHRGLLFGYVLMDNWYAISEMMKRLINKHKVFYCTLKTNRKVDDNDGQRPRRAVSTLGWSTLELEQGKLIKFHKFPLDVEVELLRSVLSIFKPATFVTQAVLLIGRTEGFLRWRSNYRPQSFSQPLSSRCPCNIT